MIRALVWKELREQGVIVAALGVLGSGVLLALALWNPSGRTVIDTRALLNDPGVLAVVMLTMTAGVVVGGTLFAAEKENGTDNYLALLPVRRRGVWVGKLAAGAGLVGGAAVVLFAVAAAFGLIGPPEFLGGWAVGLWTLAMAALAWGSVGSILTRSSLAAAGLGAVFLTLGTVILLPVLFVAFNLIYPRVAGLLPPAARSSAALVVGPVLLLALVAVPAFVSLRLYTAPDRDRHRRAVRNPQPGRTPRPPRLHPLAWVWRLTAGPRAALWMSYRQHRRPTFALAAMGLFAGLLLLAPASPFAAVWPPAGFLLAVMVGVLGWYDEQANGSKRFWLERRLPSGRLWGAKVVVGAAGCGLVTLLALLPVAVKAWVFRADAFASPSFVLTTPDFPLFTFVFVWPVYGFLFGQLAGMLFRKTVVAAAVAVMVGGVAAAAWLPSLFGGGLAVWQVWVPAAAVLATGRVLAWAAVSDKVGGGRALGRLAVGGGVAGGLIALALVLRWAEIPDGPARFADEQFKQEQIPPYETNLAGREIRTAAAMLQEALYGRPLTPGSPDEANDRTLARGGPLPTPLSRYDGDTLDRLPKPLAQMLETALEHGWQPTDEADRLLAAAFTTRWAEKLEAASRLPLGTLEDAGTLTLNAPLRHLAAIQGADALLLARGLKAQHAGDPEQFAADFALVLNLTRNVRNKSIQACAAAGRRMEQRAIQALQRWLERLHGREDLLLRIDEELARHDALCPDDLADIRLADQVVLRNTIESPGEVLRRDWRHADSTDDLARQRMDTESDLLALLWQMPWEKERHARLIGVGNAGGYAVINFWNDSPFVGLPAVGWHPHRQAVWYDPRGEHVRAEGVTQTDRRAARTLLAIRRYERTHGRPPELLTDLVPDFLPAVPTDPFTLRPFGYRISEGEMLDAEYRTPPPRPVVLGEPALQLAAVIGGLAIGPEITGSSVYPSSALSVGVNQRLPEWYYRGPQVAAVVGGMVLADPMFEGAAEASTRPEFVPAGRPILWGISANRGNENGEKFNNKIRGAGDLVYLPAPEPRP